MRSDESLPRSAVAGPPFELGEDRVDPRAELGRALPDDTGPAEVDLRILGQHPHGAQHAGARRHQDVHG